MRIVPLSTALLLVACGSTSVGEPRPRHAAEPSSPRSADYEAHEWGLVRAEAFDVLRAGAIAPPVSTAPLVVLKPVLYFHATDAMTLSSVTVRAPEGGSLTEVWPLAPFETEVRWDRVTLDPSGPCSPSPLPSATDAPCSMLAPGDLCESAGLAVARTEDASCVRVGAATEHFLFYRARVTRFTPPLAFERVGAAGDVQVTNESTVAIPGVLLRLRSNAGEPTRVAVVTPPAPGTSVVTSGALVAGTSLELRASSTGPEALRRSMLELGLSEPEAQAFLRAWSDTLFGTGATTATLDLSRTAPTESFVYFLPEPLTDGIATLALDPSPRRVRRAIAMWSSLPLDGASH